MVVFFCFNLRYTHYPLFFAYSKSKFDTHIKENFPHDWNLRSNSLTKLRPHKTSISTTNLRNHFRYENLEQYCPLVGLFYPSFLLFIKRVQRSPDLNSNHNHCSTFINTCFSLRTGTCFWSTRPSCPITKGHWGTLNYLFIMLSSLIPFKSLGLLRCDLRFLKEAQNGKVKTLG